MRSARDGEAPVSVAVGHANPDFDAYAATVAATKLFPGTKAVFLGSQNANVREFHNLHGEFLDFADLRGLDTSRIRRLIMVDTRDAGRIGELGVIAADPAVEVVAYDHHPSAVGDIEAADDRSMPVGSTTSVMVHEIREREIELTPLEASLMLLGIHEDTGSLTYPSATAYDADAVAFLMAHGADMEVVNRFLSRALTPEQGRLLDALTASLEVREVKGQQVAVACASVDEYVDSASVVAHHIVEDRGHRVVFAIVAMGDRTHVVGRSRVAEVDVGAVLARLGGGGHPQAASAALKDVGAERASAMLDEALEAELRPPLTAGDIMSSPVRTVTPDQTMREAADIMARWGHGGLPVVEKGRIAGLVTRKDVDKAVRHRLDHAPVSGFMARDIVTTSPGLGLSELESLLVREGIGRVPVLEGRKVVGIVTRKDLLRAEHGEHYLDRLVPEARAESSRRFLASVESLLPAEVRDALRAVGALAGERGLRAHVVGGFVRDMLLGRRNLDVDVVVEGDGVAFAELVAARLGGRVKVHRRFGTAVVVLSKTLHVDITSARSEYYTRPGALPTVERSSLRQDLFRRDFTINAMAAELDPESFGQVTDPFGGLRDLDRGVVRVLHSLSFVEDPTRVLRCARFAERYRFEVEPTTAQLAREAAEMGMLDEVSGARLREEMLDIIDEERCARALDRLAGLGAMALLVPDGCVPAAVVKAVSATERALKRLGPLMGRAPRRRTTLVVALAHGASRPAAERWLRSLRFGREYGEGVLVAAERGRAALSTLSDRRGMRDSRLRAALHAVPAETLVYLWAIGNAQARERIERYLRVVAPVRAAVTGDDLLELGYPPSAAFAGILAQALADRLDGRAVGRKAEVANLRRIAERALGRPS